MLAVVELISIDPDRPSVALTSAAFYALASVGLGFSAYGLYRQQRWSRSPIVLAQLLALGVGWSFRGGTTTWVSLVLAVVAMTVLALVLNAQTTLALYGERGRFGNDFTSPDEKT